MLHSWLDKLMYIVCIYIYIYTQTDLSNMLTVGFGVMITMTTMARCVYAMNFGNSKPKT